MEGKTNNKRANEPKHLRRKVVFVDPDDPDAPHWWPALVNLVLDLDLFLLQALYLTKCQYRWFHLRKSKYSNKEWTMMYNTQLKEKM
jgi:hypothetical protein